MRRFAVVAAALVGAALLAGLSGCDLVAPQETLKNAETSDGVSGTTGPVQVANAVLVTTAGRTANLVTTLVNSSTDAQQVEIRLESGAGHTVSADAAASTQLGVPGGTILIFTGLQLEPGSIASMSFEASGASGVTLGVPVLTGAQPTYRDLTPAQVTSSSR